MKNLSFCLLLLFGLFCFYGILTHEIIYITKYLVFFSPILLAYYILAFYKKNRKGQLLIILIPILLFLSDLSMYKIVFLESNFLLAYQIVLQFFIQLLYFIIFRNEGARVVQTNLIDNFKIIIPLVLVFIVFGLYFLDESNPYFYIMFVFVAIECLIIISLALFRPINNYSYYLGVIGVILLFVSNFFYLYYFFKSTESLIFGLSTGFYIFSQILLIESVGTAQKINETKT